MQIHLYELDAYHHASGHVHRWFLAAGSRGWQSRTDDTPPATTWLPLVGQWASVAVTAADGTSGPRIEVDDLRLINVRSRDDLPRWATVLDLTDGALRRVPLGPRPLNVLSTDYVVQRITEKVVDDGAPYASAVTVWQARAGFLVPDRTELRLPVYDRQQDFEAAILEGATYAGTGGLEGPAELAGVTRERCIGWVPILVPTYLGILNGLHTYSVNGGRPIEGVVRGWDKAASYTQVASTPQPGQFMVDPATGIVSIGGANGQNKPEDFRLEVKGDKSGGVWRRWIGEVIAHLAMSAGLTMTADVAGMDRIPRTVGLYLPAGDTTTHRAAYDRLVGSVARGRWYIDLADRLVVTRLARSTDAVPKRSYRTATGGTPGLKPLAGISVAPAKQVVVRFGENPNPAQQTAGDATAADVALWTQQWRESPSTVDDDIAAAWGTAARVERIDTALTLKEDADAEAPLWLAEKASPPQAYELKVRDGAPGLWIGDAVTVTDDIAGFETGATVVLYGRRNRDRGGGATLFVEAQPRRARATAEDGSALITEGGAYLMVE